MSIENRLKWCKLTAAQRARVVAMLVQMVLRQLAKCQEGKQS
jgi:hypothetical protein